VKERYKVLLPISLEEHGGAIHQPGDEVELDAETALLYAHALQRLETEIEEGK
jgi:hypothetical protein